MILQDISVKEKPIYGVKSPDNRWNTSSSNSIPNVGKEKLDALKKSIAEINYLVKERENLSKEIIEEAQKEKMSVDNFLLETEAKNSANGVDDARERISLRQKKVELSELQLNERVTCWKDVALLKRELRENEKELNEKESRLNMLNGLLEE